MAATKPVIGFIGPGFMGHPTAAIRCVPEHSIGAASAMKRTGAARSGASETGITCPASAPRKVHRYPSGPDRADATEMMGDTPVQRRCGPGPAAGPGIGRLAARRRKGGVFHGGRQESG